MGAGERSLTVRVIAIPRRAVSPPMLPPGCRRDFKILNSINGLFGHWGG
jgi:hypothetical protein